MPESATAIPPNCSQSATTGYNSRMDDGEDTRGPRLRELVREAVEIQQRLVELLVEREGLEKRAREVAELVRTASDRHQP
jgi:uncharacterized protein YlxW (UPF0749 family)